MTRFVEHTLQRYTTLYSSGCYYHTPQHADEVESDGLYLIDRLAAFGVQVDRDLFRIAAKLHDNDYGKDPQFVVIHDGTEYRRARSREEVAAWNAVQFLDSVGAPESVQTAVWHAILATNAFVTPERVLDKTTRAADLFKVANSSANQFAAKSRLLHKEAEVLKGEAIPFETFLRGSVSYLGYYLSDKIQFTPRYYRPVPTRGNRVPKRSEWHEAAMANVLALCRETWGEALKVVVEMDCGTAPFLTLDSAPLADAHTLYVGIGDPGVVKPALQQVGRHYRAIGAPAPMTMGLPKEKGISLPNQSVDSLTFLTHTLLKSVVHLPAEEIRRVLKCSGSVRIIQLEADGVDVEPFHTQRAFAATCEWLTAAGLGLAYEHKATSLGREWVFASHH